jgi:hypothetical protein
LKLLFFCSIGHQIGYFSSSLLPGPLCEKAGLTGFPAGRQGNRLHSLQSPPDDWPDSHAELELESKRGILSWKNICLFGICFPFSP